MLKYLLNITVMDYLCSESLLYTLNRTIKSTQVFINSEVVYLGNGIKRRLLLVS